MSVVSRGIHNSFRNVIRTISIVFILGLSIGLALCMLLAHQAVSEKIDSVKSSIGNVITVSPAGARGFEGGGNPLSAASLAKVNSLPHVSSMTMNLNDRLESTDTNLSSAVAAGSIGQRSASQFGGRGGNFTPPLIVIGTNDPTNLSSFGGGTVTIKQGKVFDSNVDSNTAVIGSGLASKNTLSVGSTFTAYNTSITVSGIYDSGNTFGNNLIVMPISAVQRLSAQPDAVSSATVRVDSIDNVDSTVMAIQSTLGTSADVVSQQDNSSQALAPLENIKTISLYSLIGAVIAGGVIILLTMIMIVRERRREIGVLKAIGASNLSVASQHMIEAITLSVLGLGIGLIIGVLGANPITKMLVNSSTSNSSSGGGPGGGGGFRGGGIGRFVTQAVSTRNLHVAVDWHIVLYGVITMIIIAVIGSAIPSLLIAQVRPSEVMRSE